MIKSYDNLDRVKEDLMIDAGCWPLKLRSRVSELYMYFLSRP